MAKTKVVMVSDTVPPPNNMEEAIACLGQIGFIRRSINVLDARLANAVEKLKRKYRTRIQPQEEEEAGLCAGLEHFAVSNRNAVEDGGRRGCNLPTGYIGWRMGQRRVEIDEPESIVIERVMQMGLHHLLRITVELDKNEILAEDPKLIGSVRGIQIRQDESFVIKPSEVAASMLVQKTHMQLGPRTRTKEKKSA